MFALFDCIPIPEFFRETPINLTHATLDKATNGKSIELIILGGKQSGKTKILSKWVVEKIVRQFPSTADDLETGIFNIQYVTGPVEFKISSTPDTTVDYLIKAYVNKADLVIFTYRRTKLKQLDLIRDKYLKLLGDHPRSADLSVMIVGTEAENNPYIPRRKSDLSPFFETIKLILLAWKMNSELNCRIAFANCVVDSFSSTEELKATMSHFAFLGNNYQFHDFRSWGIGRK